MNPVVEWLQSPEGEAWSHERMGTGGHPARHSHGLFAALKDDHEGCRYNDKTGEYLDCGPSNHFTYTDKIILGEIERYGLNGLPTEHVAAGKDLQFTRRSTRACS